MIPSINRHKFILLLGFMMCLPVFASISYTCDPTITGSAAGDLNLPCATLNSTLDAIYNAAFTDANASIYIALSTTSSLGENVHLNNGVPYAAYLAALQTHDPGDPALASLPATNPYGTGDIALTNSLLSALGGTPTTGISDTSTTSNFVTCTIGTPGCFDAILWVNDGGSVSNLWFRTGTQGASQYDFYSVVEHETDEVLGTSSCLQNGTGLDGCESPASAPSANSNVSAGDLFRYVCGSTARSFIDTGSACFSINGGVTDLKTYNNIAANGDDFGDWAPPDCSNVQDAVGCLGPVPGFQHDIAPNAEIALLNAVGYSLNTQSSTPEPGTLGLLGASLVALALGRKRFRRN
jgi:hypothetical protein